MLIISIHLICSILEYLPRCESLIIGVRLGGKSGTEIITPTRLKYTMPGNFGAFGIHWTRGEHPSSPEIDGFICYC